jgi:hypothetical protein
MTDTTVQASYRGHTYVIRVYPCPDAEDGWGAAYAEVRPDGRVRYWPPVVQLGALLRRPPQSAAEAIRSVKLEIIAMHQVLGRLFPGQYE